MSPDPLAVINPADTRLADRVDVTGVDLPATDLLDADLVDVDLDLEVQVNDIVEVVEVEVVAPPAAGRPVAVRLAILFAALGLFVVALGLMKSGASALATHLDGSVFTDHAWSALGLGWLGACIVLSGSPVAASSLTLLDGGAIDRDQSFAMLTGSRLGASFVVLVVGFLYMVRGRQGDRAPISIGILSLTMTMMAYIPGALLGWLVLSGGHLDGVNLGASSGLVSVTDFLFGWATDGADAALPGWALFPLGLAVLLGAFRLLDLVLPAAARGPLSSHPDAWHRKPWLMFLLGCAVALLTLSVSVALAVLVPFVAKGYLDREDALPYIAGANITTLADTLVAAMLLSNHDAARVVLAELGGVAVWTLVLLAFFYPAVRRSALGVADWVLASSHRLAGFVVALFAVPVGLIAV